MSPRPKWGQSGGLVATGHHRAVCPFRAPGTGSQYLREEQPSLLRPPRQVSGVQRFWPLSSPELEVHWAPGWAWPVLAGVGFSLDKVHGRKEVNKRTKALCPRHLGLVPGRAIAFEKPSRPPANSQELSLLADSGPPQASLLIPGHLLKRPLRAEPVKVSDLCPNSLMSTRCSTVTWDRRPCAPAASCFWGL